MWCQHCRQDVPALGSAPAGTLRCLRCSQPLATDAAPADNPGGAVPQVVAGSEPVDTRRMDLPPSTTTADHATPNLLGTASWQVWELNEQLRHVERVLKASRAQGRELAPGPWLRLDPPRSWDAGLTMRADVAPTSPPVPVSSADSFAKNVVRVLVWLALGLGMSTTACGVVLACWGLAAGRQALWNAGLPVALVGQLGLVAGLLGQLLVGRFGPTTPTAPPPASWSPTRDFDNRMQALEQKLRGP